MALKSPYLGWHRIRTGGVVTTTYVSSAAVVAVTSCEILYDDGTMDHLQTDPFTMNGTSVIAGIDTESRAKMDGWVTDAVCSGVSAVGIEGQTYVMLTVGPYGGGVLGRGYLYNFHNVCQDEFDEQDRWTTWVFQGTVGEDSTVGTHNSSLTVTPGAGNEMQLLYGRIQGGAGAANLLTITIDDGTNVIHRIADSLSLASGQYFNFPNSLAPAAQAIGNPMPASNIISGTMRWIAQISTATVSLTHTFAVACRIKGALPTATLADSLGTPTLTTNTSAVF